jgi:hypothetical protein
MGLLSDFFIATKAEVDSLDIRVSPAASLPAVQARSVEAVKLTQLQCIIDGSVFSDHLEDLGAMMVKSEGADGPWVFLVPGLIGRTLAESDEHKVRDLAIAWASTDEWNLDGGKPEEIIPLLNNLGGLARRANAENRELYVWLSL